METKGKRGAEIRRRKPDNRNSETQEWDSCNPSLRLARQRREWETPYSRDPCKMHEMIAAQGRVPIQRRGADIPVCVCWGLFGPQFVTAGNIAELESSANPQAGKPALPAADTPNRYQARRGRFPSNQIKPN